MRYLISDHFIHELEHRHQYVIDTMKLWTTNKSHEEGFTILESIPPHSLDYCFIVGHNAEVGNYIKNNIKSIYENNIVITSCNTVLGIAVAKMHKKNVYISHQIRGRSKLLRGNLYGFYFDLTESEIILFNNSKLVDFDERIKKAFTNV